MSCKHSYYDAAQPYRICWPYQDACPFEVPNERTCDRAIKARCDCDAALDGKMTPEMAIEFLTQLPVQKPKGNKVVLLRDDIALEIAELLRSLCKGGNNMPKQNKCQDCASYDAARKTCKLRCNRPLWERECRLYFPAARRKP